MEEISMFFNMQEKYTTRRLAKLNIPLTYIYVERHLHLSTFKQRKQSML